MTLSGLYFGLAIFSAVMVIAAAHVFDVFDDRVIAGAAAVELVQVGSLVHDDIFDKAATRRGVPTINHTDGDNAAIKRAG